MIARSEAEEHLRVIRSLMEKATLYRALSAPAALTGGILSIAASALIMVLQRQQHPTLISSSTFGGIWAAVFIITATTSLVLLQRDAARRNEPFLSTGFRSALRAMLPALLAAGLITLACFARKSVHYQVPLWITFYGLALLATGHFAPRSIGRLGWAFLISGVLCQGGLLDFALGARLPHFIDGPALLMAATFGLFHIIYAVATWPRRTSTQG
jgi:hypothetical protein